MFRHWKECRIELGNNQNAVSLDMNSLKEVVKILKKYRVEKITLSGKRKNLKEITDYIKNKRIIVETETSVIDNPTRYKKIKDSILCKMDISELEYINRWIEKIGQIPCILITVRKETLDRLIPTLEKISKNTNIGNVRIQFENYCYPYHSTFWKYRKSTDRERQFTTNDRKKISEVIRTIKTNKKKYKIVNSNRYFDGIPTFGITQNWKCKYWNNPTVAPDGCLMVCKDRFLISPISIFDLMDRRSERKLIEVFLKTSENCPGCYWEEKIEAENRLLEGR